MLGILYSRDIVSVSELADLLETNPRNIPEYKKELEAAGYYIESYPGRYGGYSLEKSMLFPTVRLTEKEKQGLMAGYDYLRARNDFMQISDYSDAMAKVSAAAVGHDLSDDLLIANRFPLAMSEEELRKRYDATENCIRGKKVFEMEYLSLSNEVSHRFFHPYKLFMYNNAWFALGFDEKSAEIRYFKLNRIQSFKVTERKFRVLLTYNERDYLDEYGNITRNMRQWGSDIQTNPMYDATLSSFDRTSSKEFRDNFEVRWNITKHLNLRAGISAYYDASEQNVYKSTNFSEYSPPTPL